MEQRYLIDTNVIIDAQMGRLTEKGLSFLEEVLNKEFIISFITFIEVLGYQDVPQSTRDFIALANMVEINKAIIDRCIALRKTKKIKLPDAIIAATALVQGLTLVTRNTKDFQSIAGLACLNPHEL